MLTCGAVRKVIVLLSRVGRWEMIVWLTNVADPSPSAQVYVSPSMGGVNTTLCVRPRSLERQTHS